MAGYSVDSATCLSAQEKQLKMYAERPPPEIHQ